jgi:translation initiation factor IF-2
VADNRAIGSLRHVKDDVREVRAGLECGIKLEGFDDIKPGDVLEAYEVVQVAQEL